MSLVPLALHAVRAIQAALAPVRHELAVPVVPGVGDSTEEQRKTARDAREEALAFLARRGVSESEHARALNAIREIEHQARVLVAVLAPSAVSQVPQVSQGVPQVAP